MRVRVGNNNIANMNVIKFAAIIFVLLSNGVYCYIPHGDLDLTSLPKPVHFPLQPPMDLNNRPMYESNVGKLYCCKRENFTIALNGYNGK